MVLLSQSGSRPDIGTISVLHNVKNIVFAYKYVGPAASEKFFLATTNYTGSWTATSGGNRIGKKIFLKGIKVSLMIEQSQKRAYCNYWLGLIRNKVASTTSLNDKAKVFEGLNSTIPMDYIDTDKVDIKFMKKISIRMPNQATAKDMVAGSGLANLAEQDGISKAVITNPQRIEKFYVPMNRVITYGDKGDGNDQFPVAKDHYQWVLWAYDNHSTSSGTDIGKIHLATKLNFTDV